MLKVYVADMELHGVLLFATEQRPSLSEEGGPAIVTGQFIHNYPLIYGLLGRNVEAYAVISSLHFLSYECLKESKFAPKIATESLHYGAVEEQLKSLAASGRAVYAFPAFPLKVTTKKFFMQALGSGYAEARGALKTVYPRLEHYVAIVPPSKFRTLILANNVELPRALYIRIGMKRMGLFKLELKEASIERKLDKSSWSTVPVNLYDVSVVFGYEVDDVIKLLETRSKPPGKVLSSIIGYVRAKEMFEVREGRSSYIVPLPLRAVGG
jgi:CRISPR-associated protein Csc1